MNYFSKNLKYLIKRFDTTQSQLALYVGVGQNSVSNWINEISTPDILILVKIHQFFGCSLDALVLLDLANGKIITHEHVEEFKRNGKVSGKVDGKVEPVSSHYFIDDSGLKNVVNEPDPVLLYSITNEFKKINEKIDQLRVIAENMSQKQVKK